MIASLFAHVPFEQYRVVNTADFDEAHPLICQALNSARFQVLRGKITHNQLDLLPCGNLSLLQLRYGHGAEVSVDPDCLEGYYLLVLSLRRMPYAARRLICLNTWVNACRLPWSPAIAGCQSNACKPYSGTNADKVSEIAGRFGFTHLGEFSQAYRQAFGETPKQTRGR
ncbi:AraC family transcriptional regulator [Alcaligenaceae bacterium]|nr:AraC family transcriptional regulator [Alcaligenaceae bacterium]